MKKSHYNKPMSLMTRKQLKRVIYLGRFSKAQASDARKEYTKRYC